jgi:hypothetical protein
VSRLRDWWFPAVCLYLLIVAVWVGLPWFVIAAQAVMTASAIGIAVTMRRR